MNFNSQYRVIDRLGEFTMAQIKTEPMFFHADWDFAFRNGGVITRSFLRFLDPRVKWVIDSRVHMLMPGWYPCIPGWHHDDVPRHTSVTDANVVIGQPNYKNPAYHAEHILTVVDAGTGSLTEFLEGELDIESYDPAAVYKAFNGEIERWWRFQEGVRFRTVHSGEVVKLDANTFHRGMPATGNGWRIFIRATQNTQEPVHNELRTQVQVYMSELEAGW